MANGGPGAPHDARVVAVVPAYNEAARVGTVVLAAGAWLPVVVVDDGSSDDTAAVAERAGATVARQTPNQGKGAALRAGMRWALAAGFDAIVTLDADGQHDPAEIPLFLAARREQNSDLVIGAREYSRIPPVRRIANTLGRWSLSWAVGQPIADNQSGYRLLSRRMMTAVLDSAEAGFEFEVEMIVTCILREYRLDWVPIRTIYADESSHIDPLHHAAHFTRVVFQTRRAMRR